MHTKDTESRPFCWLEVFQCGLLRTVWSLFKQCYLIWQWAPCCCLSQRQPGKNTIMWVALIFLLAWGKQQDTRGNVYLALCHDWDEQCLNKRSSICSVWISPTPNIPESLTESATVRDFQRELFLCVSVNCMAGGSILCLTLSHLRTVYLLSDIYF